MKQIVVSIFLTFVLIMSGLCGQTLSINNAGVVVNTNASITFNQPIIAPNILTNVGNINWNQVTNVPLIITNYQSSLVLTGAFYGTFNGNGSGLTNVSGTASKVFYFKFSPSSADSYNSGIARTTLPAAFDSSGQNVYPYFIVNSSDNGQFFSLELPSYYVTGTNVVITLRIGSTNSVTFGSAINADRIFAITNNAIWNTGNINYHWTTPSGTNITSYSYTNTINAPLSSIQELSWKPYSWECTGGSIFLISGTIYTY